MTISLICSGNSEVTVLNSSIAITTGDLYSKIYVSAGPAAREVVSYLLFTKKEQESVQKYQEIYPLKLVIEITDNVVLNTPNFLNIFIGGNSYFVEISISDIPNVPVSLIVSSSNSDLQIIGSSQLNYNESKTINRFRLYLNPQTNVSQNYYLNYTIQGNYSNLFELDNDLTQIKLFQKPNNLNSTTLTFQGTIKIYSKTIDIIITSLTFQAEIYYQIYNANSLISLEMNNQDIINQINNYSEYQVLLDNNIIIGIIKCNDTSKACIQRVSNLQVNAYQVKCFALSPAGVQSNYVFTTYFQPYRI